MRMMKTDSGTIKTVKLQKYLALAGLGSRRKCEKIIKERVVSVNGETVLRPGIRVSFNDIVRVGDKIVRPLGKKIYLALNKPTGYICSNSDSLGRQIARDLLPDEYKKYHLYNVGRLDYNSSGLIFYTNDGDFANIIMHPSFGVKKTYRVKTSKDIDRKKLKSYKREGTEIKSIKYTLENYELLSPREVILTLNEGKNREIRRVFDFWGIDVKELERIKIGIVELGELRKGDFRKLTAGEIRWFLSKQRSD